MLFIPDVPIWTYIITVLLPVTVALVTARGANKAWGAWMLAFFTALTTVLTTWLVRDVWDVKAMFLEFITLFTIAVAVHFGFWKPVAVTGSEGKVQQKLPGGIGASK